MAITDKIKTLGIGTTWVWELFPYENVYPTENEFSANPFQVAQNAVGAGPPNVNLLDVISGAEKQTMGIRSFNFSRRKDSPDSHCTMTLVGHPPKNAYPGVWCLLTSANPATGKKRIRFIGQIETMNVNYNTQASGLVQTTVTYRIREWSTVLRTIVKAEALNISQSLDEPSPFNAANYLSQKIGEDKFSQIVQASYNPFEMAGLVLLALGAISQDKSKVPIQGLENYYQTATRMPTIPPALMLRLGVSSVPGSNPFANGFVKFVSGVRKDTTNSKIYEGSWDGVFGKGGIEKIDDYVNRHSTKNTGRPVGSNIGIFLSLNESAWTILNTYCDPAHNEFFTDIYYEQKPDGTEVTQPVFVFRDKPFLMNIIDEAIPTDLSKFSTFDELPRVKVDSALIMGFNFVNTIVNSPNLIRVSWVDGMTAPDVAKAEAQSKGYSILAPEMERFGGQEFTANTNFMVLDPGNTDLPGFKSAEWWAQVRDVVTAWHSYHYRMGNGVLVVKDNNLALSVGHNVQFEFGNFTLVGHVDALNFSISVDERGLLQNTLQISISRIVQKIDDTLRFIDPRQFGRLADRSTEPNDPGGVDFPNFPSLTDLIGV